MLATDRPPLALNDLVLRRLCDALKRGHSPSMRARWLASTQHFQPMVLEGSSRHPDYLDLR